jgi:hypothetical protein
MLHAGECWGVLVNGFDLQIVWTYSCVAVGIIERQYLIRVRLLVGKRKKNCLILNMLICNSGTSSFNVDLYKRWYNEKLSRRP